MVREKFMAIQKGHNVTSNDPKDDPKELSERQKGIVSRLFETGQKIVQDDFLEDVLETSASLATYFKVNERTIRRDLSTLQAKRIICHIGPDKGGRWIILASNK